MGSPRPLTVLFLVVFFFSSQALAADIRRREKRHWVDIWATMPQLTEPANLPPAPYNQTGVVFADATLRQTIQVSLSASILRLQISNVFGISDLPITAATLALPLNGSAGTSAIEYHTLKPLTFSRSPNYTIPSGALVVSDPIDFPVKSQSILTISLYLAEGQTTNSITSHPGSRTTSYFAPGNQVNAPELGDTEGVLSADHWYFISTLQSYLPSTNPSTSSLAIIGDSITDGRGSTTNGNNRWSDVLLSRLQKNPGTQGITVLNLAAGGNRVLYDGLGPNALSRLDRDVLSHPNIGYVLIYEGVNDIGTASVDVAAQHNVGTRLIAAYDQMITRLHSSGIPVFGATITPFSGPGQTYTDPERERTRQRVNGWIRRNGRFDGVVDFDAVVRNKTQVDQLMEVYNSGDYLHLNPEGYRAMGDAVDLALFERFADGVDEIL
ncbi:GDSL-like Lipase/Acylhydrolase [Pseudomassariella vexata]|uniref:GDSL-like Lipase/Acylhydrolase n=1 Tax=Pseudomassariella vexata TaxID=1141098 RepID=A0A1Y2E491_9PEZI|nr:GDSL-like Lipase/Acylhydrolase [Pseudomassariella vexata]ORY66257.1 GDSL-like Lipase/Acylhydrolase [Pseudomassariella vexata]